MKSSRRYSGFTLIELVMVILSAGDPRGIAIPNFIDFRTDAKNSATQGGVGAMRAAIVDCDRGNCFKGGSDGWSFAQVSDHPESARMHLLRVPKQSSDIWPRQSPDSDRGCRGRYSEKPMDLIHLPAVDFNSIYDCNSGMPGNITSKGQVIDVGAAITGLVLWRIHGRQWRGRGRNVLGEFLEEWQCQRLTPRTRIRILRIVDGKRRIAGQYSVAGSEGEGPLSPRHDKVCLL